MKGVVTVGIYLQGDAAWLGPASIHQADTLVQQRCGTAIFFNASIMKAGMVMFQLVVVYSLSGHPGGDSPGTPDEAGKLLRTVCSCQIHRKGCCSDSAF